MKEEWRAVVGNLGTVSPEIRDKMRAAQKMRDDRVAISAVNSAMEYYERLVEARGDARESYHGLIDGEVANMRQILGDGIDYYTSVVNGGDPKRINEVLGPAARLQKHIDKHHADAISSEDIARLKRVINRGQRICESNRKERVRGGFEERMMLGGKPKGLGREKRRPRK
jgi:hypothetical protein